MDRDRLRTGGAFRGPLARDMLDERAPARELLEGERVGRFRIVRELSRGGMGVVYLAERDDGEFAQRVALKWCAGSADHGIAEERFRREREILAGLEHPGIARLIDGGRTDGNELWFAMEYVEGEPIDRWCGRRAVPLAARVRAIVALCEALDFAHRRLLIHRDVKPANVLVDAEGRVRLLDFGIARLLDRGEAADGAALTPGFASPEQWAGDEVTVASDVYQSGLLLGVLTGVLGEGATHGHVTRVGDADPVALQPMTIDATRLRGLPRDLAAILVRATHLQPEHRYPGAAALAGDLERFLASRPVAARGGGAGYRLACLVRRHPWATAGSLVALGALATLGVRLVAAHDAARIESERAVAEAQRARAALGFTKELLIWAQPNVNRGEPVSVDQALARAVEQLRGRLDDAPALRAELLHLFGEVHALRREPEKAIPLLEEAYALEGRLAGLDPLVRADTATRLGNMLNGVDDRRAMQLFRDSIAAMHGRSDAAAVRLRVASQRFLAGALFRAGELLEARRTIESAIGEAESTLPIGDEEHVYLQSELATYASVLGEVERAAALRRALRERALRDLGPDHPAASQATMHLVRQLSAAGAFAEARALLEQDRPIRARLWGEASGDYAWLLAVDASILVRTGDLSAARAAIEDALRLAHAAGATGAGARRAIMHQVHATVLLEGGDLVAAEDAIRAAIRWRDEKLSAGFDFGHFALDLIGILRRQGHFETVPALIAQAEAEMRPLPEVHVRRASLALERAYLAEHRGDVAAARAGARTAIELAARCPAQHARESLLDEARVFAARLAAADAPSSSLHGVRIGAGRPDPSRCGPVVAFRVPVGTSRCGVPAPRGSAAPAAGS